MPSPAMLAVHLVSAFVMGWVLRRGEAALWRLVRLSGKVARAFADLLILAVLFLAAAPLSEVRPSAASLSEAGPGRWRMAALRHSVIRRGPPVLAGVA